eukprot:scaffold122837_cov78-Phaeocystis_antarctica.AAC.1
MITNHASTRGAYKAALEAVSGVTRALSADERHRPRTARRRGGMKLGAPTRWRGIYFGGTVGGTL